MSQDPQIRFRTATRGYNKEDVNNYISKISINFQSVEQSLKSAINQLHQELESQKELQGRSELLPRSRFDGAYPPDKVFDWPQEAGRRFEICRGCGYPPAGGPIPEETGELRRWERPWSRAGRSDSGLGNTGHSAKQYTPFWGGQGLT